MPKNICGSWPLSQAINQSGTIVCGGGQLHIEVVEVPKKLSNQSGLCAKIFSKVVVKKQSPVETTKVQISQTTTVDNNDTLWGTPWTSSEKIINQVADQDKNLSSHSVESKEQTEENREEKIKSWGAPCSLLKLTESEPSLSWGTPWDPSQWWQTSGLAKKMCVPTGKQWFKDPDKTCTTLGKLLVCQKMF